MELFDDNNLSKIFGLEVRITLTYNEKIEGKIYSYCKQSKILICKYFINK